jgi:hypothetical protein
MNCDVRHEAIWVFATSDSFVVQKDLINDGFPLIEQPFPHVLLLF